MSKSKGNVYYPSDLLAKGFSGGQLRFFLIYGPYRKNLTSHSISLLRQLRNWIPSRTWLPTCNRQNRPTQTEMQEGLINKITSDFENHMNNDLDVKSAFDNLAKTIMELHAIRQSLSSKNIKNLINALEKVDSVLQCIF